MITQVDLSGSNSASAVTNVEYNLMKARYLMALISDQSKLRSIELWKSLKVCVLYAPKSFRMLVFQ